MRTRVQTRTADPAAPIGHAVTFELERPVASKKNGRQWLKFGGRMRFVTSDRAYSDECMVANIALAAAGGRMPFGEHDALRLDYQHDVETDRLRVTVTKIGELPRKGRRGTKRDVHGMVETIADALQGVIYPNDNQVDAGSFARLRGQENKP